MTERRRDWERLERRHRTEEIWESFGIHAEVDLQGKSTLRSPQWKGIALAEGAANVASLAASAQGAGLPSQVHGEEVVLQDPMDSDLGAWSTTLHGWLLGLYESNPGVFLTRGARQVQIPEKAHLPRSAAWLERLYQGEGDQAFVPREKKPLVADLHRSRGVYLASVDDEPLVIMDAMSQIATLAGGFAPPEYQSVLDAGETDGVFLSSGWDGAPTLSVRNQFEAEVQKNLPEQLCHFAYANSGAEANEKAYALARLMGPGGKRVLAFEGSFHGRTLLSLYSTWNKVKREPYQIRGYEVEFTPFPGGGGKATQPEVTSEWLGFWSAPQGKKMDAPAGDPLMAKEIACLEAMQGALEQGNVCAVNLEPMQSEGGDNYGTARFFNGLRCLTRAYGIPLIMDEVQTGFGLGGTFFWHQQFQLKKADGTQDYPDLLICAKKAQVGLVVAVWPDPFPTPCQGASVLRGRLHAEMQWQDQRSCEVHGLCDEGLERLASELPDGLIGETRSSGYAFALDLPSAAIADKVVAQRFYQGAMVYKAGAYTLRYRLSQAFTDAQVADVFEVISSSLKNVIEWAGGVGEGGEELFARMGEVNAPAWVTPAASDSSERASNSCSIRRISKGDWAATQSAIMGIEARSYEPARQDDEAFFTAIVEAEDSIVFVAESEGQIVGFTFAAPLEGFSTVRGPNEDAQLGKNNTLYSADVTVDPDWRGQGLGQQLKEAQLRAALQARGASGEPRYRFVTGRNRVGHTLEMGSINERFGAYRAALYTGEYGEDDGVAVYYRIPLRRVSRPVRSPEMGSEVNVAKGIQEPLTPMNAELQTALARGCMDSAWLTKMTLSNFTTPNLIRYMELMKEVRPAGTEHMYLTSCRDEMADKAVRTLRSHRKEGEVCISFKGAYFGHTTAGARSLSDWEGTSRADRMAWFDWPHLSHPGSGPAGMENDAPTVLADGFGSNPSQGRAAVATTLQGMGLSPELQDAIGREADCLQEIVACVEKSGASRVLGIFLEVVQERTGSRFSERMWRGIQALATQLDIPLVLDETSTGLCRSGKGLWRSESLPVTPDVVVVYAGGQLGHVFVSDRYFLGKPLQLISTWDGDEVSALRLSWLYRTLRREDTATVAQAFEEAVRSQCSGATIQGEGAYLCVELPGQSQDALLAQLESHGVRAGRGNGNRVVLCPTLTGMGMDEVQKVAQLLATGGLGAA